jgi:hypothetical protein
MSTKTPSLACELKLAETGDKFVEIREGINSYVEGVNKTMSGLVLLDKMHSTSLMDNMMIDDEHFLDVSIPARLILDTKNFVRIPIPMTTWLISQTVERVLTPDVGFELLTSGLKISSDFDRSSCTDENEDISDLELFRYADMAFGNDSHNVYSISVDATDLLHVMYNPKHGRPATLAAFAPKNY